MCAYVLFLFIEPETPFSEGLHEQASPILTPVSYLLEMLQVLFYPWKREGICGSDYGSSRRYILYLVSSVSHLEIPHLDGQELRAFKNLAISV